jgi:energy-converting hydrogenase Eha subunit E
VLYRFGYSSHQYAYFFWLTDVLLALGAFLLVCAFFRRACLDESNMWRLVRLLLLLVFILVLGISLIFLSRNYNHLFTLFIYEFSQNLYFTCLVLNTLLYLLIQQVKSGDEELGLLVCGVGIQFAGPAASLALLHLTSGQPYAQSLNDLIWPLCTLGMLSTWFYGTALVPKTATGAAAPGKVVSFAEAAADLEVFVR